MVYQTEETRQRILDQAATHFSEYGFFDTQMKDIATAIGMSRHTLYRYYQNKIDLGFAIIEDMILEFSGANRTTVEALVADRTKSGLERIEQAMRSAFLAEKAENELRFMAEFDSYFSSTRAPEDFGDRLMSFIQLDVLKLFEQLFEQGQDDGSIRSDKPARLMLMTVFESIYALKLRVALRGGLLVTLKRGEAESLSEQLLELLVSGIASRNDGKGLK
jgi:AcrR family transcriptional regulator